MFGLGIDHGERYADYVVLAKGTRGKPELVRWGRACARNLSCGGWVDLTGWARRVTNAGGVLALDAPLQNARMSNSHHGLGLNPRFADARCAEAALRVCGMAVSWPTGPSLDPWVVSAQATAAVLKAATRDRLEVIETWPHGSYRRLGGPSLPQPPGQKKSRVGRSFRAHLLDVLVPGLHARACPTTGFWWSADRLDATACAIVALRYAMGRNAITCFRCPCPGLGPHGCGSTHRDDGSAIWLL